MLGERTKLRRAVNGNVVNSNLPRESARGLAQSKTRAFAGCSLGQAKLLECASPLALCSGSGVSGSLRELARCRPHQASVLFLEVVPKTEHIPQLERINA